MNWMNFNEPVSGVVDSLCFVAGETVFIACNSAFLARFDITNAIATPKKWFIKVHQVHRNGYLEQIFINLMNLMNFDELTYYLRLFFAMDKREGLSGSCKFGIPSTSKFIRFIVQEAL